MAHAGDDESTPPLKRHEALQPLSREHMGGLIQARNLRNASGSDRLRRRLAIEDFLGAWRTEIRAHFDDEERLLLPLTDSPELRGRLLSEHTTIRQLADHCAHDPDAVAQDPALVRRIGDLLHDHIRWEERVYFEAVQRDHPDALAALVHESSLIEQQRPGSRARYRLDTTEPSPTTEGHPMSDERLREPPAERFATDTLTFDLLAEAAALRAEPTPARHGHRQKTLFKNSGRTVALFVLDAGAHLPEHAAAGGVTIQPIQGEITVTVSGEPRRLQTGALLAMAPGIRHDVRATSAAAFLLQVSLAP